MIVKARDHSVGWQVIGIRKNMFRLKQRNKIGEQFRLDLSPAVHSNCGSDIITEYPVLKNAIVSVGAPPVKQLINL